MPRGKPGWEHGRTSTGYRYGCRCEKCVAAMRAYLNEWRHRTGRHKPRAQYLAEIAPEHGTESRYKSCRCSECRDAANAARRKRRASNPEARERENARRMARYHAQKQAAA